ncbi:hypothetical protein K9M74_03890 [Candidatus Woesearchaeota archaeon]|nr:hypothetical protein [Candidatus Woesearchaeota archaeon]
MGIISSFLAGILAAFTPCILVLFPALVYRFTNTPKQKLAKELLLFTTSFIGIFFISAMFLSKILSSTVKEGFQLGIGLLFIVLGILAITKRFNPLNFPLIKNPFLFGILFAIIASVNPCSFAYLGIIATTQSTMIMVAFIFFAIGLLVPSVLFVLFGKALFTKLKKTQQAMKYLNNTMNILLIIMGIYLMIKITHLGSADILMAVILLGITFLVLLRSFYFFQRKLSLSKILLLIALLSILVAALWHCDLQTTPQNNIEENNYVGAYQTASAPTCSSNIDECKICKRCTIVFGLAVAIGLGAIMLEQIIHKKR